ncbi:hypothetical protein E2C01_057998 [Portunus trituberculatus]|uniref:Uncharacterized protein n=1 Tax=Portunus trituberculatus TaxID=210409 RepID=A0A5B7GV07_PORTR|nr:hypothetical protein [Portunus trituberculatus]
MPPPSRHHQPWHTNSRDVLHGFLQRDEQHYNITTPHHITRPWRHLVDVEWTGCMQHGTVTCQDKLETR